MSRCELRRGTSRGTISRIICRPKGVRMRTSDRSVYAAGGVEQALLIGNDGGNTKRSPWWRLTQRQERRSFEWRRRQRWRNELAKGCCFVHRAAACCRN
ncbi:hypothetical protein KCP69_24855 [Salmonella enterica subsp. enterica]|nr:hypothetical protein KCP69_24855 [Salmonella enterica subsp. enterica]